MAEQRKRAICARVSSHDQKSDLDSQVNALKGGASEAEVYVCRHRFEAELQGKVPLRSLYDVLSKRVSKIYVTHEDRLWRSVSTPLRVCGKYGAEMVAVVVVVNSEQASSSPQEELVQDLIEIIASFSTKLYGLMSRKTKRRLPHTVKEMTSSQSTIPGGQRGRRGRLSCRAMSSQRKCYSISGTCRM